MATIVDTILEDLLRELKEANRHIEETTSHCSKCNGLLDIENLCINPDCYHYTVPVVIIDVPNEASNARLQAPSTGQAQTPAVSEVTEAS